MTGAHLEQSWVESLKEVQAPLGLVALSLRGLGISSEVIGRALSIDLAGVDSLVKKSLSQCSDTVIKPCDQDYRFDIDLVGRDKLEALTKSGNFPISDYPFSFAWTPTADVVSIADGWDAIRSGVVDISRTQMQMQTEDGFFDWFKEVRKVFMSREPRRELFLLIPLPTVGDFKWSIFRPQRALAGQDDALRLIASLSALGLGYGDSGHRTKFFTNLIRTSQQLFDHIGVGGAVQRDVPADKLLANQLNGLAKDALLIRQETAGRSRNLLSEVFAMDFSNAWVGNPNRFGDWSIRDRAEDADEMADALLWLMVRSSGICLQVSLTPRSSSGKTSGHSVQVLAPKPWIKFLSKGHGAQKGDARKFELYCDVEDPNSVLYYVNEPLRYDEIKYYPRLKKKVDALFLGAQNQK